MKACKDECYRHYYNTQLTMSVRHASWILNGYDPRCDKPSYNAADIQARNKAIKTKFAVETLDAEIDTKLLFGWAAEKYPAFCRSLPSDLIMNTASVIASIPICTMQAVSTPDTKDELKEILVTKELKIAELTNRITELNAKISELSPKAERWDNYCRNQTEKGKKSPHQYG